jgi:hypothetical protein
VTSDEWEIGNPMRSENRELEVKLTISETSTPTSLFQRAMIPHVPSRPDLTLPTDCFNFNFFISCIYRHLIPSIISHALFCVYLFIAFERDRLHSACRNLALIYVKLTDDAGPGGPVCEYGDYLSKTPLADMGQR